MIKLLVVDDSGFFQKRIAEILKPEPSIKIIGFANNGKEAIEKVQSLSPDVITLDYEMPVMDGLTALRNIMKIKPTPVLMFSSLTYDGARVTLDALDAGAVDFLPKNFEDLQRGGQKIQLLLTDKIKSVATQYNRSAGQSALASSLSAPAPSPPVAESPARSTTDSTSSIAKKSASETAASTPTTARRSTVTPRAKTASLTELSPSATPIKKSAGINKKLTGPVDIVLIGTSTGGPVALQKVLTPLPSSFSKPIILVQHMPATFTAAFAERLNNICGISVKLAEDGDALRPGLALLAPGGKQLMVERNKVRVIDGDERLNYKPSVDIAFASAAKHYPGRALAIVLTGMGADGKEGARLLKETGSSVWAQDEETSVIYGMPMAIAKANLADAILPLQDIAVKMVNEVK